MKPLNIFLLILALIMQSFLTSIPLVFLVLLSFTVLSKDLVVFPIAFFFGIFLDIFAFQTLGITSAFFITFLFLVLLYQRKFEIATNYFIFSSSFIGSSILLLILGNTHLIIFQAIAASVIGLLIFKLYKTLKIW
jgi:cell shape-determining protein MreD